MLTQAFLLSALAAGAFAGSTVDLLVGLGDEHAQLALGIDGVNDCTTTMGLVCTAGYIELATLSLPCDGDVTATVTLASNTYIAATATSIDGASASIGNACTLSGTTEAVCSLTIKASADGESTAVSTTYTLSGTDAVFSQVPVTAGAAKLSSTCSPSGNAAAPTGVVDIVKVLVPAAALVAGVVL